MPRITDPANTQLLHAICASMRPGRYAPDNGATRSAISAVTSFNEAGALCPG